MILRELLVKLGLDLDSQSFTKGILAADAIKKTLGTIVDFAAKAGHALLEGIESTIAYSDELDRTSQSIGIATDALQEWRYVASLSAVGTDELNKGMFTLAQNMQKASDGGEEQQKAFSRLGIKLKDGKGNLRAVDDIMSDVVNNLQGMEDGAKKTSIAMDIFGKTGKDMIPIINQGVDGIEALRQEARDLGLVLDEVSVKAGAELGTNIDKLKAMVRGLWRSAIGPLLPAINQMVKSLSAWFRANGALIKQKIQDYIGYAIDAVKTLGSTLQFLIKNSDAVIFVLKGIAAALLLVKAGAIAVAAAWALAFAPLVAAVAGVMYFLDDVRVFKKQLADPNFKGKSLLGLWQKTITDWLKPNANEPWWLKAIKELVRQLAKALDLAKALGITEDESKPKKSIYSKREATVAFTGEKAEVPTPFMAKPGSRTQENNYGFTEAELADPNSFESKYVRARNAGLGNFRASMAAYGWFGQGKYVPEARVAPSAPSTTNVSVAPVLNMSINGSNLPKEELQSIVREEFQSLQDGINESTYAAVSQEP